MAETNGIVCGNCGWPVDAECGCPEPDPLPRVTKEDVEALARKDIELDAIQVRSRKVRDRRNMCGCADCTSLEDVPVLVAEVRRQDAEISDLRRDIAEADGFVW